MSHAWKLSLPENEAKAFKLQVKPGLPSQKARNKTIKLFPCPRLHENPVTGHTLWVEYLPLRWVFPVTWPLLGHCCITQHLEG